MGATALHDGDLLLVYGRDECLQELDRRPSGPGGEAAHRAAVARQAQEEAVERSQDVAHDPKRDRQDEAIDAPAERHPLGRT